MNPTARPRFRTDLVAEPIEEDGHRYIDVIDPDTGNVSRFFDVEYSIACAMDGERDVQGLAQWAREELGVEPSPKELATVIATLGDLGYLETATTAPARTQVAYEQELVPGVVSAPRAAKIPVDDVELGRAGANQFDEDVPTTIGELELGHAGGRPAAVPGGARARDAAPGPELGPAGGRDGMEFEAPPPPTAQAPMRTLRPVSRHDHEDDGPTHLPPAMTADYGDDDVSVDLSDHLAISASDVKEAVRASKVMKAVDLPADLQAALDGADAHADEARRLGEKTAADKAAAEKAAAERENAERASQEAAARAAADKAAQEAVTRAASTQAAQAGRPAVELPKAPVGVSRPKAETGPAIVAPTDPAPAEAPRSKALLYVFLLVLLLAGAYVVWTRVLNKPLPWESADATPTTTGDQVGTAAGPGPGVGVVAAPPPPPPPPPPSATLAETAGVPTDVAAGQAAQIAEVVADGKVVAVGDQLVRFVSNAALEQRLKGLDYDITAGVPKEIDRQTKLKEKADASNNAAASKVAAERLAERTKRLEEKRKEREDILLKIEGAMVKAPVAGTVAVKVKKGARATATQVIATITPPVLLAATFDVPASKTFAADAPVRVASKAGLDQRANCIVTKVEGAKVSVACPSDAGLSAGTDVVLE